MRRLVVAAIVGFWLVMVGILVYRTRLPSTLLVTTGERAQPSIGEEWMAVFHRDQKIGYTHHRLTRDDSGFAFSEEALLRLIVLQTPQTVRTRIEGHAGPQFELRDVAFELSSGVGNLRASGIVSGNALRLTLRTGTESSERVLPLNEPLYLPTTLRASVWATGLHAGRRVDAVIFDPTTLKDDRVQVTVEGQEPVPQTADSELVWKVREEFRGLTTTAWIDGSGVVRREEGPMGLVLVRQTADEALNQGWATDTALDLVAQAAVPVARPIDAPRQRTFLRVRLSGIPDSDVPSDEEQVRDGSVLIITRPEVSSLPSYTLPYQGQERAADLAPTVFLQSQHPRVQAVAREVLGNERDAKRAAVRLNDWVYGNLRKVPTISIPNALQVLEMGEGDCNEHAVLLAALGRAVGLPMRVVAGTVYLEGAFFYHAWCEVWLGRWVSVDPTFHQFPADATHIKLVVGDPDEEVRMLGIIGRLGIEVLDDRADPGH